MNAPLTAGQLARTLAVEFGARAAVHDREGSFPHRNFTELQQAGLLSLAASRHLGGQGASLAQLGEVVGAVAQGCPATALVLTMQYMQHRAMGRAGSPWPEALARQLVQESVREVSLINALRVEPELGSPARGGLPATVARRAGEGAGAGWRITGHKIYSTGAPILRWYVVWARTDEEAPRTGAFLVRAGAPGIRIDPTWDHLGLRASGSHDVHFDSVPVPASHALELRLPQDWARGDSAVQAEMVVLLGRLYTGVARAAREWLLDFLRTRTPASLGAPLATLPRVQETVGTLEGLLLTNERLLRGLAADVDAGVPVSSVDSGLIKSTVTHNAVHAVEVALSLTSNHGLARRNPLERHLRDVLCGRIHTPQDDSVHVAAGKAALG
ncbi:acyl-CoA dehydrogenase family protein [Acidovorax sp. A1169]|uniref:acyl-CoA dehydrogenase family protein n=1 Tax=Acidovorax sp. A1169 TaxID=3059524 RepID=UPI002737F9BB|nr:acyl-CoA dehydrogenase family protein [Acidovorax sp. A1169]MDP4078613.1 acyl-CoA dehydrogenase family protein [Acidovorax sp. A1169]